jgi:integrase
MQKVVNAAPTAGEGDRVQQMISALVTAGGAGGYLVNSRLAKVHWQAGERALPAPAVSVAGEAAQWVDPAEIPSDADVAKLGQALAAGVHGDRDELMANTAAYSGLRWGELIALTVPQIDGAARAIAVDARLSRSPDTCSLRRRRTASIARRSTHGARRLATRLLINSPLAFRMSKPSNRPGPTPSGCSSHRLRACTGDPPISAATSSNAPT